MGQQTVRKTFKYKLKPTPEQERELERVVMECRWLYNTALEQRIFLYRQRGISLTRYSQEAELKDLRAEMPEYAAIHSHVLQDVLTRLDKTYQAFFRRIRAGQTPGLPRYQGRARWHSFTYKEYGNGARLDNGYLVLAKIGRMEPSVGGNAQDRHDLPRGGWLVCLYLLCGCSHTARTPYWAEDRH
jgi:putative transposase